MDCLWILCLGYSVNNEYEVYCYDIYFWGFWYLGDYYGIDICVILWVRYFSDYYMDFGIYVIIMGYDIKVKIMDYVI